MDPLYDPPLPFDASNREHLDLQAALTTLHRYPGNTRQIDFGLALPKDLMANTVLPSSIPLGNDAAISPNALAAPSRNLIYRSLENLLVDTDEFDKYELDELDEQLAFAVVYAGIKQGLVLEENRTAKRQRYQEDVEENRAAKRQKYEDNSAAIKASERNRYWNDPAVRLAKRAAERKRYRRGHRTTTTTQRRFFTSNRNPDRSGLGVRPH
eukprot:Em1060g2a